MCMRRVKTLLYVPYDRGILVLDIDQSPLVGIFRNVVLIDIKKLLCGTSSFTNTNLVASCHPNI